MLTDNQLLIISEHLRQMGTSDQYNTESKRLYRLISLLLKQLMNAPHKEDFIRHLQFFEDDQDFIAEFAAQTTIILWHHPDRFPQLISILKKE